MTVWKAFANYVLPIPLLLFLLLSLPLPKNVRQGIILFIQRVFDLPVVGVFKLLHIMLWLTAVAFLSSARQLQQLHTLQQETVSWASPKAELSHLSKRWRAERNLWIAAFAFCSWCCLAAFYREAVRRLALERRLADLERSVTATEAREPSASREVTSKAAAAAASRERTPAAVSPAKPAAGTAAPAGPAGGVQMQAIKKDT